MATFALVKKRPIYEQNTLADLWQKFCDGVVGQDAAKEEFKPFFDSIYYQQKLGKPEHTCYGAFLLCGPTGVGKGEFARSLATTIHGSSRHILTINCGEYHASHEMARLVGAPPGYLGHRETQAILSQARINAVSSDQSPISIILWDEIEKAHPDIYKPILSILDRAEMRLGDNNLVRLENTLHIFTSNLGNKYEADSKTFLLKEAISEHYNEKSQRREINNYFKKEFLGRLTQSFFFKPFTKQELLRLYNLEIEKLFHHPVQGAYFKQINISSIRSTKAAIDKILDLSKTGEFGARDLQVKLKSNFGTLALEKIYNLVEEHDGQKMKECTLEFDYKRDRFSCVVKESTNGN